MMIACAAAHPIVPAFERGTADGLLLLAELSCTACHAAPDVWRERLAPKQGPNLAGVGSRLGVDALRRFLRDPRGTTNDPRIAALADYLASLREAIPPMPAGDAERGKALYHSIGCVACHDPAAPIALAKDSVPAALAHFLFDPLRHRPSMRLSEQEAADLAQHLGGGTIAAPPAQVDEGRAQFVEQRCTACHGLGEKRMSKPLAELPADRGCLAAHYDFSETQRSAIQLALRTVQSGPPTAQTAQQKIDWHFARLNCHACHERDGKGGVESARTEYFGVNDPGAESLGEMAKLPPRLDRVGRKLTREWFAKLLWGEDGSVRPYMTARMPRFAEAQVAPLIDLLEEADRREKPVEIDVSGLLGHQRAEAGRKLIGASGLGCVSCHGIRDRKSLGPPVVRLTHTVERLRPEYFKELLLDPPSVQPGTLMPPLFNGRKQAAKEVESIWTYLKEVDSQPLPEGLFSDADFELKPADAGRPIVLRSFIEGAGTHAIGVGFPQGLNATFDARACRWTTIWKGRFLDAMSNWQDRAMKPIAPLGTDVKTLPGDEVAREFRGYRLEKSGAPTMLYAESGVNVEDRIEPDAEGAKLVRTVRRSGVETREVLSW